MLHPVEQQYLLQARQMQAMSFIVHIPLVCFGIAFPLMVVLVEWLGLRTGVPTYRVLARRWSRILVALFAVGVITGTILSFEMGLLWPNFTGTFGGVFGLGFAIEGFSFFMEAVFIGIYVYGWDRLPPRWHLLSGIPVVIAGFTGAFMVVSVNAWMNDPTGFRLRAGKVVDIDPIKALFENHFVWSELIHMYIAAFMVTGFLVSGAYALGRLRKRAPLTSYERIAMTIPLTIASAAAPIQFFVGDWLARAVAISQPVKLAAIEGLTKTTRGASEHLLGWYTAGQVKYGIAIPHLLSLLAFHSWSAKVEGLDAVAAADRPPINIVRLSFQAMVGIGTLLALLGVAFLVFWVRRGRLPTSTWFDAAVALAGPAALVAVVAGWVTTEVGRQPWVVYGVMRTADAVTGARGIPVGFGTLAAVYAVVICGLLWVLRRLALRPIAPDPQAGAEPGLPAGAPGV